VARRAVPLARSASFLFGGSAVAHSKSIVGKKLRKANVVTSATATSTEGETFQYQAEVSRLMDLIVNSLYSSKEIFLRELVSNASDALDKARFDSLTNGVAVDGLEIKIRADAEAKTLTIEDTGIGMTKSDIIEILGTIASSGTSKFMDMLKEKGEGEGSNLIGQFGVGFYSAFLVAQTVTVITKNSNDDTTWQWQADQGSDGFTVKEAYEKLERGTKIILTLKEDSAEFADNTKLKNLVKTYSEFITFPIKVWTETQVPEEVVNVEATAAAQKEQDEAAEKEGKEPEKVEDVMKTNFNDLKQYEVANESKPLWVRPPKEVTDAEYNDFFKATFASSWTRRRTRTL